MPRTVQHHLGWNTITVGEVGDATKMKFIVQYGAGIPGAGVYAKGLVFGEKMGSSADKILEELDTRGVASPIFHLKRTSHVPQ